jgi:hypothetical protein
VLTLPEKIIFSLAVLLSLYAAWLAANRIARTIARGQGQIDWSIVPKRVLGVLGKTVSFQPVFRARFWPSFFHAFVGWAFIFYLLVNLGDVIEAFFEGYVVLGTGNLGNIYRLIGDVLTVAALLAMSALLIRRFGFQPPSLTARKGAAMKARTGIRSDSYRWLIYPGACRFPFRQAVLRDRPGRV